MGYIWQLFSLNNCQIYPNSAHLPKVYRLVEALPGRSSTSNRVFGLSTRSLYFIKILFFVIEVFDIFLPGNSKKVTSTSQNPAYLLHLWANSPLNLKMRIITGNEINITFQRRHETEKSTSKGTRENGEF